MFLSLACSALFLVASPISSGEATQDLHWPVDQCGALSLATCLVVHSEPYLLEELDEALGHRGNQTSLLDLQQEARRRGLWAHAIKVL